MDKERKNKSFKEKISSFFSDKTKPEITEEKLRQIINEVMDERLKQGIKVGTHSIYLDPDKMDLDGNYITKANKIEFGSSGTVDSAITRGGPNSLNVTGKLNIIGDLASTGTLHLPYDTNLYGESSNLLATDDSFHIGGNLIVDGTYPAGDFLDGIIADGNTLNDTVTFVEGNNVTITVSGNSITFSSGTTQLGTYVDHLIIGGNTLNGDVTFAVGAYATIGVNGNQITIGSTIPITSISDVTIDANKDWNNKSITNLGTLGWGGDVTLYRDVPNQLKTGDTLFADYLIGYAGVHALGSILAESGIHMTDVNIYRSGAGVIKTDDNFYAVGNIVSNGTITHSSFSAGDLHSNYLQKSAFASSLGLFDFVDKIIADGSTLSDTITFAQGSNMTISASGSTITFSVASSGGAGSLSDLVIDADKDWNSKSITNMTSLDVTDVYSDTVYIGSDVDLYRSGANTLKTDDNLYVGGNLIVDGTYPTGGTGSSGSLGVALARGGGGAVYYQRYNMSAGTWSDWIGLGGAYNEIIGYDVQGDTLFITAGGAFSDAGNTGIYSLIYNIASGTVIEAWTDRGGARITNDAYLWDSHTFDTYINQPLLTTSTVQFGGYKAGSGSIGTEVTIPVNSSGIGNIYVEDGLIIGYSTITNNQFSYAFPFGLG